MKKQERHQAPDLRPRIEHQVGAQDPGDGAGRADERRGRGRVGRREPVRRDVTAGQVEDEKRDLAHAVFDVVAEHVHRGLPQAGDRRDPRSCPNLVIRLNRRSQLRRVLKRYRPRGRADQLISTIPTPDGLTAYARHIGGSSLSFR